MAVSLQKVEVGNWALGNGQKGRKNGKLSWAPLRPFGLEGGGGVPPRVYPEVSVPLRHRTGLSEA